MHEAVTKSSTATKSYFPTTSDDLLPPITLASRSQTTDTLGWSHDLADPDYETKLENWKLSMSNDTTSRRRAPSASLQKITFPSTMPSLAENNSSTADISVLASEHALGGNRWRFNGNGQLVDSEWELADEIVRLKIGEVGGDATDDVHAQIRTPPKSKLAAAAVAQFTESSPLETSSDASVDSSPHASDHQISISHSRGSSTDTTISSSQESALSAASNTLLAPSHPLPTVGATSEVKERPHSFSGGLSSADLRRLQHAGESSGTDADRQMQQQQPASGQFRETNDKHLPPEQLSYPSLATNSATLHRPQPQPHPQVYDYRSGPTQAPQQVPNREDLQLDYNIQQRNFNPLLQGTGMGTAGPTAPTFVSGRPNNAVPGLSYRQLPRGFPQQGLLPSPTTLGYPGGHHTSHLSLGNTQQLYDMMLPGPPHENHPAVTRVQQQHNVFRGTHQHSASDPSAIRDPAALALLNNNMQAFTNGMFPPNMAPPLQPLYPGQFYGTQDAYPGPDVATAQVMAARLQSQYTGPYGVLPPQGMGMDGGLPSPSSGSGQNGPSANNRKLGLYKTELCRSWEEKGSCRYGNKCQFAHGEDELRKVARHPKYKTEICRTFWVSGSCPYGKRCCFIHTELPTSGATAATGTTSATDGGPPSSHPDGRTRSLSTNSDPNEASVSLLARISAKRNQEPGNGSPVDMSPTNGFQFSRPPTGSLRVDTALEGPSLKQNKSAYPSFASNGILLPASDHVSTKSPAPVTAGPDLGRHNNSRTEIVGYNHQTRVNKVATPSNSNVRHSFNGTEVDVNFTPVSGHSSFALSSGDSGNSSTVHVPRVHGHVRAGSAGNWGSFSRSNLAPSPYPHSSSPGGDITINSPWSTTELAVGSSRLHEKAWA